MGTSTASVSQLVDKISRGELRLPEMQRRYVWRSTRVRDLFDSLYRNYPSGAILIWETDEDVPLQKSAIEQQVSQSRNMQLLLDGQQRLTSLAAVIEGRPVTVQDRKRPIELLFNLEHPDELEVVTEVLEDGDDDADGEPVDDEVDSSPGEIQKRFEKMTFVVATKALEQVPHWVKVSDVFRSSSDASILKRAGVTNVDDPKYGKYSRRLEKLRDIRKYEYRLDILDRALKYEEVTEIFVRVNSLGAKLRSSDLALAQITAKWRGALALFLAFQKVCADAGFDLDLGLHLKNLVSFATGQSRFQTIAGVSPERLKAAWSDCVKSMEFAINFARSNAGIESPVLLSSPYLLVALGYYAHRRAYQLTATEEADLRFWVLLANAKGRYSRGSSETVLDQDLATIRTDGGPSGLVDRLRSQVGRLEISPEELEGRNQRSALFKTMFLAFKAAGAKDWRSNLAIALEHRGSEHQLQFHHVFPKGVLKASYSVREADDIANLAFIGGRTNQWIRDKAPSIYFPELLVKAGVSAFTSQCIPTDADLLDVAAYREFLAARRKLVADRLNDFLGVTGSAAGT